MQARRRLSPLPAAWRRRDGWRSVRRCRSSLSPTSNDSARLCRRSRYQGCRLFAVGIAGLAFSLTARFKLKAIVSIALGIALLLYGSNLVTAAASDLEQANWFSTFLTSWYGHDDGVRNGRARVVHHHVDGDGRPDLGRAGPTRDCSR